MQNYKSESVQKGEKKQRNKEDKLLGLGREKKNPPHIPSPQKIVFASTLVNAVSPSALSMYQPHHILT